MNLIRVISKLFVKPFYRENAGAFIFLVTVMFCIVNRVDGAGLFEYHYVLIKGLLTNPLFLGIVLFLWCLYGRKCHVFIHTLLNTPAFIFADIFNRLGTNRRFILFFLVQLVLQLPVLLYAVFIFYIAINEHYYFHTILIGCCLVAISAVSAGLHIRQLDKLNKKITPGLPEKIIVSILPVSYVVFILRYIGGKQKLIWLAIKIFTCGILYLYASNTTFQYQDIPFAFLLFNFGILANGVLINRIRDHEETYLSFYRGLPVSITTRMLQYGLIYLVVLLPEIITACILAPQHLHYTDAWAFMTAGYGVLLLLTSISFLRHFNKKDYFKVIVVIFFVEYALLITAGVTALAVIFLLLSVFIFLRNYYRFEE